MYLILIGSPAYPDHLQRRVYLADYIDEDGDYFWNGDQYDEEFQDGYYVGRRRLSDGCILLKKALRCP